MDELKAILHEMADNLASRLPHLHEAIDALDAPAEDENPTVTAPAQTAQDAPATVEPVNPEAAPQ